MYAFIYNATFSRCLRVSIFPSFLSLPMVLCLSVPSGRSSRLSRAVSYLAFNMPTFILQFFLTPSCVSFIRLSKMREDPRGFARRGNDFPGKSRFALVPFPFFSFLFFPVKSPAKYPRGRREKEVHDLRTDRIKWGNLARRILERKYKDEGTTAG